MKRWLFPCIILVLALHPSFAKNIDLSTVPKRDSVQLTIYNSEDLTLVRETRLVSFKKGRNTLQFSWANTLIDPTSVELRFPGAAERLEVIDTTYPHQRPQMLYWSIASDSNDDAVVEISYFTSGITWTADYTAITRSDRGEMSFEGFVRIHNDSGEDYEGASVRLVVGTINLVEKIAQLARVGIGDLRELSKSKHQELRARAARSVLERAVPTPAEMDSLGYVEEKKIFKQGLSEYFIYTIDGRETIPSGWSKRLRTFEGLTVPFRIQYRYRKVQYGDRLVRMLLVKNDEESKLGTTPLPGGKIRVFRNNDSDGLSFLAEQQIKYVPVGDEIEVDLGVDPEVVFEMIKMKTSRENIWMKIHGADVLRRIDDGRVNFDLRSRVAGWDERDTFVQRIRNHSSRAIEVQIRRRFPGHVVFRADFDVRKHDFQTVQFSAKLAPGEKRDLAYEVVRKKGRNAKQENVTIE